MGDAGRDANYVTTLLVVDSTDSTKTVALEADPTTKRLLVDIAGGTTALAHGVKTVSTAGTDEALASSTTINKVVVQAQTDNTGLIAVGATGVDATESTGTGIILYAGDTFTIETDNLADVFIDATVSGEGVRFAYFT